MDDKEKIEEAIRQIDKHIEEIRSFKFKFLNGSLDDILSHITNKIDKPFNTGTELYLFTRFDAVIDELEKFKKTLES